MAINDLIADANKLRIEYLYAKQVLGSISQAEERNFLFASKGLVDSVNIAFHKAAGGKVNREDRIRVIADLCGFNPEVFKSTKSLGRETSWELIELFYGSRDVDFETAKIRPEMALLVQYLVNGGSFNEEGVPSVDNFFQRTTRSNYD